MWTSPSRLRSRLLMLVGLATLPAMILIILSGLEQRKALLAEAEHNASHLVETMAGGVDQVTQRTRTMLSLLAQMPPIQHLNNPAQCNRLFSELRSKKTPYANIGLINMDGTVGCSALPFPSDVRLDDRAYFKRAVELRRFVAGDFQTGRITHKESINFAYPVIDHQKRIEGVLFAALPLHWLYKHLMSYSHPDGATVSVIDPSRQILLTIPNQEDRNGQSLAGTALIQMIKASNSSGIAKLKDQHGISRMYVFTSIPGLPKGEEVYISIGLPVSYIYAKADRQTIRNIVILALAAALALLIAWKGGDVFLLRQLGILLAATRDLREGRLDVRAEVVSRGDELAELTTSFNNMAGALEKHANSINRLNRIYAVLSSINGTILRVRNKNELLREACRIAVEHGRFKLAWIGLIDKTKTFLQPVYCEGEGEAFLRNLRIPLKKGKKDQTNLAGRVIWEQKDIVINNIEHDPILASRKRDLSEYGFRSAASFALRVEGELVGTFSLYADEPHFFDAQELKLLRELAADTSLGLEIIGKEDRLYDMAHFDAQTGLPNRHEFEDRLRLTIAQADSKGECVAILAVGIDHLRHIRDGLGSHAGDQAIRTVAKHLSTSIGKENTVARIGMDDFGIILSGIETNLQTAKVVDRFLKDFPHILKIQEDEYALNVHIGSALYPQDGEEVAQLTKNAELAMHHAPVATVDTPLAFFSEGMEERVRGQRRMEQQLRHAIERDELILNYQPVVDIETRTVMGFESLLRWNNAELGQVSPADFIPMAEESGLIVPIGEWVLEHAFKQAATWAQRGLSSVRIVVNVSVKQLCLPDFVERVREIRKANESEGIELILGIEVTESQLMDNIEQALGVLNQLKVMGFTIYIDDFGTGYSSLSYLRQLPVDILKIDISFVRDIEHDPNAVSMAKGIIALAHSLDLRVIAEGVETPGQLSVLKELHCDYVR